MEDGSELFLVVDRESSKFFPKDIVLVYNLKVRNANESLDYSFSERGDSPQLALNVQNYGSD